MQAAYGLVPGERVLQKTAISFNVSVWELFWPLAQGATLVLARPGGQRDAAYLAEVVRRQEVGTLHFVPSMLAVFLQEESLAECLSLRRVVASGEALGYELVEQFYERLPQAALYNLYGPTEAAVDVTHWSCAAGRPAGAGAHRAADRQHAYATSWTAACGRCRWAWRGNCTWRGWAWRGATCSMRN